MVLSGGSGTAVRHNTQSYSMNATQKHAALYCREVSRGVLEDVKCKIVSKFPFSLALEILMSHMATRYSNSQSFWGDQGVGSTGNGFPGCTVSRAQSEPSGGTVDTSYHCRIATGRVAQSGLPRMVLFIAQHRWRRSCRTAAASPL